MAEYTERVQQLFSRELRENERLRSLQAKVEKGTATYKDAEKFAELVGKAYADSFKDVVGSAGDVGGDLYFEIAQEVFPPGLHSIYESTSEYVEQVQRLQNRSIGVGLRPVVPDYGEVQSDYLRKLAEVREASAMDQVISSESTWYAQKIVDATLRMNAEAHENAGLEVSVTRIYDGVGVHRRKDPCEWCLSRCGEDMTLAEAKEKDTFSRHPGCGCTIIYRSARGKVTKRVGGGWWQEV